MTEQDKEFSGFHKFRSSDGKTEFGSFEVFLDNDDPMIRPGWYWWLCHKGCIAESDQHGPFPTAEGAYLDALENYQDLPDHGDWAIPHSVPRRDETICGTLTILGD